MSTQDLILNLITFKAPVKEKEFSFTTVKQDGYYPLSKWHVPQNITDIIQKEETENIDYLYTDFVTVSDKSKTIKVDLLKNTRFAKHYYTFLINGYFIGKASVTNANFIFDNELWFETTEKTNKVHKAYKVFTVKVQIDRVTNEPEIVLSYEGISLIHNISLHAHEIDTELFSWVVFENQLYKYVEMPDKARYNLENVFPVLNNRLKKALGLPTEPAYVKNKYLPYYNNLKEFFDTYINTAEFKKIIPLNSNSFVKVDKIKIKNTTPGSNLLLFGQEKTHISPYYGLKENGPCNLAQLSTGQKHIKFIFIFHTSDKDFANEMVQWLNGKKQGFQGLKSFTKLDYFIDSQNSIRFDNLENPFEEIKNQLANRTFDHATTRYIAVYISPFTKHETDPAKHKLYYQVKEELLKYRITSQVIDKLKINAEGFNFSMPNIAIAILAKLNGVPWRLQRSVHNELIVGIGAFKSYEDNCRYVGSAFCFSNDGHFQNFDCYSASDTYMLAGSIRTAIDGYLDKNKDVKRLVIHFYKAMSNRELEPIKEALKEAELDIPVIIITINKTESKDLVLFDLSNKDLIPVSGTFISIGRNQFLLCNNTRYGKTGEKVESYPFPIKLSMFATDKTLLDDTKTITDLIDQVYQFSRMYWKSVKQQNLPVTIKYPEMVAELFPHFENKSLPNFGRENLWFL